MRGAGARAESPDGPAQDPSGPSPADGLGAAPRPRGRRRAGCWLLLVLLAAAAAGHWAFWYRPRPRPLAPGEGSLLAAGPPGSIRLWIPYPHQNLGALAAAVEEPDELLAAVARLAELPPPRVPRFPLFDRPPARELLVVASEDGAQLAALVRLYPLPALVARLAGTLASNPWLAGGEVESGGRRGRVSWEGTTWRLESADPPVRAPPVSAPARRLEPAPPGPLLGLLELELPDTPPGGPDGWRSPLPPGRYALRQEGDDLSLRLSAPHLGALPLGASPGERVEPVSLPVTAGIVLVVARRSGERGEALLLFDRDGGLLGGLPTAAAWAAPAGAEKLLPAGELLAALTGAGVEPLAGGELAATDREALARARALSTAWLPLVAGDRPPALALWLAPSPAARRARQVADVLAEVPLLGAAEERRWRDAAIVLEALRAYGAVTGRVAADRRSGELRLVRRPG